MWRISQLGQRWYWVALRERSLERAARRAAWLLPKRVVVHAYCRVGAHATTGRYADTVVPELSMLDALGRWS